MKKKHFIEHYKERTPVPFGVGEKKQIDVKKLRKKK